MKDTLKILALYIFLWLLYLLKVSRQDPEPNIRVNTKNTWNVTDSILRPKDSLEIFRGNSRFGLIRVNDSTIRPDTIKN